MARCDFCKKKIEPGTGKKFIHNDGRIQSFCSKKCEKHTFKLKHKGRTQKWTEEYQRLKAAGTKEESPKQEAKKGKRKEESQGVDND